MRHAQSLMRRKLGPALGLSASVCVIAGCGVKRLEPDGSAGGGIPEVVQQRFDQHCATSSCHDGTFPPDLRRGNSAAIIDAQSPTASIPFVEFGNPSNSYLAVKLVPELNMDVFVGVPMPMGRTMPPEDVAIILGWIAGAPLPTGDTDSGTGSTGMTDPTVADASSTTDDPTDPSESGSSTGTGGATDTAGDWMSICTLEDVDPGATSPVMAADEAGMIPADVGAAIENNCGCHLTTESSDPLVYTLNPFPLATLADFEGDHTNGQPRYQVALDRVAHEVIPMPPASPCDHDGQRIDPDEEALLMDWLGQGAPDGATFTPSG